MLLPNNTGQNRFNEMSEIVKENVNIIDSTMSVLLIIVWGKYESGSAFLLAFVRFNAMQVSRKEISFFKCLLNYDNYTQEILKCVELLFITENKIYWSKCVGVGQMCLADDASAMYGDTFQFWS